MIAVIGRQTPRDSLLLADQYIGFCPSAATYLAQEWSRVPDDTLRIVTIARSADQARRQPLYDSLKAIALRATRPLSVRGWALVTLLRWGRPSRPPGDPKNLELAGQDLEGAQRFSSDGSHSAETVPSYDAARVDLAQWYVTRFIEDGSQPTSLRYIASAATQYLARDNPSSFLPLGSRFAVRYRCGARWWVVSRLRVTLPLELRVAGTAAKQGLDLYPVPFSRLADSVSPDLRLYGRAELWMGNSLLATYYPGVEGPIPCP